MPLRALGALALGLALGLLLTRFGFTLMSVEGGSMAPTLEAGEVVLVVRPGPLRLLHALGGPAPWRDGAVVVLADPQAGAGRAPLLVKRVVAGPGETLAYAAGARSLGGGHAAEPWLAPAYAGSFSLTPVTLDAQQVFVLGDDRLPLASRDSRSFGPVGLADLRGEVVVLLRLPWHAGSWRWPAALVR